MGTVPGRSAARVARRMFLRDEATPTRPPKVLLLLLLPKLVLLLLRELLLLVRVEPEGADICPVVPTLTLIIYNEFDHITTTEITKQLPAYTGLHHSQFHIF